FFVRLRPALNRFLHQLIKTMDRGFHLAVMEDDIPEVLQRAENRGGYKLHGDQLTGSEHITENKPQQYKENGLPEDIEGSALEKGKRAHASRLFHLQVIDLLCLLFHPADLGKGEPKALYQFDV